MTRLMALAFWGKPRNEKEPLKTSWSMIVPLGVLGFLSVVSGMVIGFPSFLYDLVAIFPENFIIHWLGLFDVSTEGYSHLEEWIFAIISVLQVGVVAFLAYDFYILHPERPKKIVKKIKTFYELVYNKYYIDELYGQIFVRPIIRVGQSLWAHVDKGLIDQTIFRLNQGIQFWGATLSDLQNGNTQRYLTYIFLGAVALLTFILMG